MDKLEKLLRKQEEMAEGLSAMNKKVEEARVAVVTTRGQSLFKMIHEFADLFTTGVVHQAFEGIRQQLVDLKSVDENYLATIASSEPYGLKGNDEMTFLVSYLLGSLWRADARLFEVLAKIEELGTQPGNFFTNPKVGD